MTAVKNEIMDEQFLPAGENLFRYTPDVIGPGIYLCKLKVNDQVFSRKIIVLP